VSGTANSAEPSGLVELAADELFAEVVAVGAVGSDGSFAALDCGDNWANAAQGVVHGRATYWLRASDAYGNAGVATRSFSTSKVRG